jgi:HPt (histidine-containing phosphotransfer) domain-containing protein
LKLVGHECGSVPGRSGRSTRTARLEKSDATTSTLHVWPTAIDDSPHRTTNAPGSNSSRSRPAAVFQSDKGRAEVAGLFLADAPRLLDEIRAALAAGDADTVHRAAHGLRGAAGYVGGKPAADAAQALESAAAAGQLSNSPHAFEKLKTEVNRLTAVLAEVTCLAAV